MNNLLTKLVAAQPFYFLFTVTQLLLVSHKASLYNYSMNSRIGIIYIYLINVYLCYNADFLLFFHKGLYKTRPSTYSPSSASHATADESRDVANTWLVSSSNLSTRPWL